MNGLQDNRPCADAEFTDNVAYAKFLNRLETAVLPAIEDAESAAAARTAGPPARNNGAAAEPSSLKRRRPPSSAGPQPTGAQA